MDNLRRSSFKGLEVIKIGDLMEVLGISKSVAYKKMSEIKAHSDKLKIKGRVHINDLCDYYGLDYHDYI